MGTPWQGPRGLWDLQLSSEDCKDLGWGLLCLTNTYHRTWLVQAWGSRLALLAFHSFPTWDTAIPLGKKEDGM